jgi:hypothetical protein
MARLNEAEGQHHQQPALGRAKVTAASRNGPELYEKQCTTSEDSFKFEL